MGPIQNKLIGALILSSSFFLAAADNETAKIINETKAKIYAVLTFKNMNETAINKQYTVELKPVTDGHGNEVFSTSCNGSRLTVNVAIFVVANDGSKRELYTEKDSFMDGTINDGYLLCNSGVAYVIRSKVNRENCVGTISVDRIIRKPIRNDRKEVISVWLTAQELRNYGMCN